MIILGIETSCDETSAALLKIERGKFGLLSHVTSSSVQQQAKYGGIVPEVAARKQIEFIIPVLEETFRAASLKFKAQNTKKAQSSKSKSLKNLELSTLGLEFVTAIAVTVGPGLATSLQVGIDTAKALAYVWQKPLIPVNHLEGHLYSPLLASHDEFSISKLPNKSKIPDSRFQIQFPAIGLIVSGGHTELVLVRDYLKYKLLGRTRDDAAGEAFDKVAKLLGLSYPGGPVMSRLAQKGNPAKYSFPRGMIDSADYNFSFSGLKTAVLYAVKKDKKMLSKKELPHVAASFQQAVIDVLVTKAIRAGQDYKAKTLLLGGGVAANHLLRGSLEKECHLSNVNCQMSPQEFTGDNAAMIALAGYFRHKNVDFIKPKPQLKKWQIAKAQPNLKLI